MHQAIGFTGKVMEDESLEIKDWSLLFANYRGQWVALADDEVTVLAAAPTAKGGLPRVPRRATFADSLPRAGHARYLCRL
jgi:hypothetical protein